MKLQRNQIISPVTLIFLAPLWLVILKVIEVFFESPPLLVEGHASSPYGLVDHLGYGIFRRLDDVEFWVVLALGVAAIRIKRAGRTISAVTPPVERASYVFLIGIACAVIYAVIAFFTGDTFGWHPLKGDTAGHWAWRKTVYCIEGAVMCGVIVQSVEIWWSGWHYARLISSTCSAGRRQRDAARTFINACTVPFIGGYLFFAVVHWIGELHVTTDPSATHPVTAMGTVAIWATPYVVLMIRALYLWQGAVGSELDFFPLLHSGFDQDVFT